jgi:tRNA G18 (ribose-2'-O)-methylase SpoU
MISIFNINDKRISDYKRLKGTPTAHSLKNIFIAESENIVLKLLNTKFQLISLFAIPSFYKKHYELISSPDLNNVELFTAEKSLMKSIVGFNHHSGIMAIAKKPPMTEIKNLKPPIVILNGIINSENVGSIIRNCVAFGIRSIIFDSNTSDPYLRRSVRVSMGAVFLLDYFRTSDLKSDILFLQKKEIIVLASELNENSKIIFDTKLDKNTALIFGNETKGIDKNILKLCNQILHIPIKNDIESLNVASSSAIILNYFYQNI